MSKRKAEQPVDLMQRLQESLAPTRGTTPSAACGCETHVSVALCVASCRCECNADYVRYWKCRVGCGQFFKEDPATHDCSATLRRLVAASPSAQSAPAPVEAPTPVTDELREVLENLLDHAEDPCDDPTCVFNVARSLLTGRATRTTEPTPSGQTVTDCDDGTCGICRTCSGQRISSEGDK